MGANNPSSKKVICLNNMKVFDTLLDASKYANLKTVGGISKCCDHKKHYLTSGRDPITKEKLQWEWYQEGKTYKFDEQKNRRKYKKRFCKKGSKR